MVGNFGSIFRQVILVFSEFVFTDIHRASFSFGVSFNQVRAKKRQYFRVIYGNYWHPPENNIRNLLASVPSENTSEVERS